jgi:hypothetical protein
MRFSEDSVHKNVKASVADAHRFHAFRPQSRAPAARWVRVIPIVRRIDLAAFFPDLGLN